jgi:hypothetical protein
LICLTHIPVSVVRKTVKVPFDLVWRLVEVGEVELAGSSVLLFLIVKLVLVPKA